MSLIYSGQLRARAQQGQQFTKSAGRIKLEAALESHDERPFDIFLSPSKLDEEEIHGLKLMLEDYGQSAYVDWIEDPHLDREKVSKETAELLRAHMKSSRSLLCVTSAIRSNRSGLFGSWALKMAAPDVQRSCRSLPTKRPSTRTMVWSIWRCIHISQNIRTTKGKSVFG